MAVKSEIIQPCLHLPHEGTLETFIGSSPWLMEHNSLLRDLVSNYRSESLLFQNVTNILISLSLIDYRNALHGEGSHARSEFSIGYDDCGIKSMEGRPLKELLTHEGIAGTTTNFQSSSKSKSHLRHRTLEDVNAMNQRHTFDRSYPTQENKLDMTKNTHSTGLKQCSDNSPKGESVDALLLASLSKPPETSISEVKVSTKVTNLAHREYKPLYSKPKKQFFHFFSNKKVARGSNALGSITQYPMEDTRTVASEAPQRTNSEPIEHTISNSKHANTSSSKDSGRRQSLVGQNLPLYIYEQIQTYNNRRKGEGNTVKAHGSSGVCKGEAESSDISAHKTNARSRAEAQQYSTSPGCFSSATHSSGTYQPKSRNNDRLRDQRISNLLANSLSLYPQNESRQYESDAGPTSTESTHIDSRISDLDREYASPFLFTRSLEDIDANITYENFGNEVPGEEDFGTLTSASVNQSEEEGENVVDGETEETR